MLTGGRHNSGGALETCDREHASPLWRRCSSFLRRIPNQECLERQLSEIVGLCFAWILDCTCLFYVNVKEHDVRSQRVSRLKDYELGGREKEISFE